MGYTHTEGVCGCAAFITWWHGYIKLIKLASSIMCLEIGCMCTQVELVGGFPKALRALYMYFPYIHVCYYIHVVLIRCNCRVLKPNMTWSPYWVTLCQTTNQFSITIICALITLDTRVFGTACEFMGCTGTHCTYVHIGRFTCVHLQTILPKYILCLIL